MSDYVTMAGHRIPRSSPIGKVVEDDRRCLAAIHDDLGQVLALHAIGGDVEQLREGVAAIRHRLLAHLSAIGTPAEN